jgi:sulfite reductase (ferredoxin)
MVDANTPSLSDLPAQHFWKTSLQDKIAPPLAKEIDVFETEITLKKSGKIDDKVFAETRLRRGVYGQRYDNGHRNDGKEDRPIPYPAGLTKGPGTHWHAPGMIRIKIPFGGVTPVQMDVLADVAEEYSDAVLHVTTRQDFQLHFVHIEETPSLFRRLAAVGITTREACGNTVRNVTACPISGVCPTETFDVTPYAKALAYFLLGHPDTQDFGRKFKFAFSGCKQNPCGLVTMHDMGFIATTRQENGKQRRGFETYVGGGLGALPYQAQLFDAFVPEEEILPLAQAVARIFARHGEKAKRNRARVKFLVSDWGVEKFKQTVLEERAKLPTDARWTEFLGHLRAAEEKALHGPGKRALATNDSAYFQWLAANVRAQRQSGYSYVTIALPLGDLSANQMRDLADIARKFVGDTLRTTVEQNIILRWVSDADLPALYAELKKPHLADPYAETIVDVTACPGTDTCKLGVSSSRGLAAELRTRLAAKSAQLDEAVKGLRIKVSGCFNSCGQHHIADLGFYGVSRKIGNYMVPHFQVILGGQFTENAASYGQGIAAIPSKAIPAVVDELTRMFVSGRAPGESFQQFIARAGKAKLKMALDKFVAVPEYNKDDSFYRDWGDVREYSKKDIGTGECAGEVVSLVDFGLTAADRQLFEAQLAFDAGNIQDAASKAFRAMVQAAQALIKGQDPDISDDPDQVAAEFRRRFHDTKLFFDPFQADKFANFFFKAHATPRDSLASDKVRILMEEAQLFIEAAYSCNVRMTMGPGVGANTPAA